MKKRLFTLSLAVILAISTLAGCSKKDDKYVISNENVDIVQYKGLETEKIEVAVTDTEITTYIEYIMNFTKDENDTTEYTINDLTDEKVKEISGGDYGNISEYREYIKGVIAQNSEEYNISTAQTELFQSVVENSELKKYDEDRLQNYKDYLNEYYTTYAEYLGHDFETFYKEDLRLSSKEEYDNYVLEESLKNLKTEYIIKAIATAEQINITDEEINAKIKEYITNGSFSTEEEVLQNITKDEIKTNLQYEQVLKVIYDNAKFVTSTTQETTEK